MGEQHKTMPSKELLEFYIPSWDKLSLTTAWLCCNCSLYTEMPQCIGCTEQGTVLCQTCGCSCGMNWEECDYLCYENMEAFCISLKQCSADCMKAIWCMEAARCSCCFIFHCKGACLCHMCPCDPFICCKCQGNTCCIEERYAIPCDNDLPMECGCFGFFCMGEGPLEKKDRGWQAFKPACMDGDSAPAAKAPAAETAPAAAPAQAE